MRSMLPGGTADKAGLIHEALWGVLGMIEMLNGEAESICIEEPGVDGAEFYLQRRAGREYWQAKRQVVGQKTWTMHLLAKEGVIEFFQHKYQAISRMDQSERTIRCGVGAFLLKSVPQFPCNGRSRGPRDPAGVHSAQGVWSKVAGNGVHGDFRIERRNFPPFHAISSRVGSIFRQMDAARASAFTSDVNDSMTTSPS